MLPPYKDHEIAAALESLEIVAQCTEAKPAAHVDEDNASQFSWRLSGLITLADWVGSDATFFPFESLEMPLHEYWGAALWNAERALKAKDLYALAPKRGPTLAKISRRAAEAPRPMQVLTGEIALSDGPQLFVLEDATGSGKTEAALLLAARLMEAGRGEGVYIALPTMATANAMYARGQDFRHGNLDASEHENRPSLILAHGKARLSQALVAHRTAQREDDEPTVAASCNSWISDDRRRAFFADIGAGTIDQAFLAVLPKKHLTLRQYALAGRILIIDEAHCFDAYMREELDTLLRLHAMNGGSAIVLSATLSRATRRKIAGGFS